MPQPDATWHDWFDQHGRALVLLARQWCPTQPDAEDAVQEAFVRFWPRRAQVDDPKAYLYRCTRNAAMDQRRNTQRRQERDRRAASHRPTEGDAATPAFERHDDRDRLEAALAELPQNQREAVVMKVWGGLTFAQVGEAMGVPLSTAASRYRYGIAALRKTLEPEYGDG